jgi:hypothetical protein
MGDGLPKIGPVAFLLAVVLMGARATMAPTR